VTIIVQGFEGIKVGDALKLAYENFKIDIAPVLLPVVLIIILVIFIFIGIIIYRNRDEGF